MQLISLKRAIAGNNPALIKRFFTNYITDALSTILRLLREESEEASWLI